MYKRQPQYYDAVLADIKDTVTSEKIIISIAPSVTIQDLKEKLGQDRRIVRAMPNTPALVGMGVTGVCYEAECFSEKERDTIRRFFESFGSMELVEERLINAVVCVSGSSPAYVFILIEAMADAAVADGMPRPQAYKFAAQAVMGSAKMVLETGMHPGELKDMVCSPAGTTIEAVRVLERTGFRSSVIEAMKACADIAKRM